MARLPNTDVALTYDDVLMVPNFSDLTSRHEANTTSGKLELRTPFIAANMDTVCEENMAIAMHNEGAMGIIHRFLKPDRLDQIIKRAKANGVNVCVSVGINGDSEELLHVALKNKVTRYCVDVAHGHHSGVANRIDDIRRFTKGWENVTIIAGNVATPEGAMYLASAGADIVKVGIGPGSHCTTRVVTGHGIPQLTAIQNVKDCLAKKFSHVEIIADGGIRTSGDIAKALAVGADYVMLGRLLAGCHETPGEYWRDPAGIRWKTYRGMASHAAQRSRGRLGHKIIAEGVVSNVRENGAVADVVGELRNGLRSALSYAGAHDIFEFRERAKFIRVTGASYVEGTPHGA